MERAFSKRKHGTCEFESVSVHRNTKASKGNALGFLVQMERINWGSDCNRQTRCWLPPLWKESLMIHTLSKKLDDPYAKLVPTGLGCIFTVFTCMI
jgi:hypothetical protein